MRDIKCFACRSEYLIECSFLPQRNFTSKARFPFSSQFTGIKGASGCKCFVLTAPFNFDSVLLRG